MANMIRDKYSHIECPTQRYRLRHRDKYLAYQRKYHEANKNLYKQADLRRYRNRRALMNKLKSKPCFDCGIQYMPWIMQFDHREPSIKEIALSNLNISEQRMLKEIEKCDLVCANCHCERTHQQRIKGVLPCREARTLYV